ncbi:MAG: hypothetical protein AAGH65_06625 [Pseudomonadota bacterium]
MRLWPAMLTSLLALPGLAVLIGGINELASDGRQFSQLFSQVLELARSHSDIFEALLQIAASVLSLVGVAVLIICSKI